MRAPQIQPARATLEPAEPQEISILRRTERAVVQASPLCTVGTVLSPYERRVHAMTKFTIRPVETLKTTSNLYPVCSA